MFPSHLPKNLSLRKQEGDLESKAQYWYFDSNERSLYLKQDTANSSKYYLEATEKNNKDSSGNPIYDG